MNQSQKVLVAGTGLSGTAAARLVLDRGGECSMTAMPH